MSLQYNSVMVTGAAGFIGYHLSLRLLEDGCRVVGVDNLNPYYDVNLKKARLKKLRRFDNFSFHELDLSNGEELNKIFENASFDIVVNLAAQAGVRYSLENPKAYVDANLVGFCNILEGCRHHNVKHLVFASSSSVYGANTKMPFSVHHNVDHPVSLYAATKKANELMAHTYSHLYGLPCTGLRFFTVYGPWGRPDMAYFSFASAIKQGKTISLFNHGKMKRDFTYIDDIVQGTILAAEKIDDGAAVNLGTMERIRVIDAVNMVLEYTGHRAEIRLLPDMPTGPLNRVAENSLTKRLLGWEPEVKFVDGLHRTIDWYLASKDRDHVRRILTHMLTER